MARDHEEYLSRRRHQSAAVILAIFGFGATYPLIVQPQWLGIHEGTTWFLRFVGILLAIAVVGMVRQLRRQHLSKLDDDVEHPPTTAGSPPSTLPPQRD